MALPPAVGAVEEPPPFVEGSETLVVIPDTEGYNRRFPGTFSAMMEWVVRQREARRIRQGVGKVFDVFATHWVFILTLTRVSAASAGIDS